MSVLSLNTYLRIDNFILEIKSNIDFSNDIVGIYGPSGSGKTLLLRIIAGLEKNSRGSVIFNRLNWQNDKKGIFLSSSRRKAVNVFQENRLFENMNVKNNIMFGYRRNRNIKNLNFSQITNSLEINNIMNREVKNLSGGEKQRVAIARSLLAEKNILLLDEPFSSQDISRKNKIINLLKDIYSQTRLPMLIVSHSMEDLINLTSKTILLDSGKIIFFDKTNEIISNYHTKINSLKIEPANYIKTIIHSHDEKYGLTNLKFQDNNIVTALVKGHVGSEVIIKILSKDIFISKNIPKEISIRNILNAKIIRINKTGNFYTDIYLLVGKEEIISRITFLSMKELELKIGDEVYILIKSTMIKEIG